MATTGVASTAVDDDISYLISLQAVRERAQQVFQIARDGGLQYFEYDAGNMESCADFVMGLINRDFGPNKYEQIPPHGRWQHFDVGGVERVGVLVHQWGASRYDDLEITRRLIDLFMVSVLLDGGAGDVWAFKEPISGVSYGRSEGIAVASLNMFLAGCFSSGGNVTDVSAKGLSRLDTATFEKYFQISPENPMIGVESRVELLRRLGDSLLRMPEVFGAEGRPGNLVDALMKSAGTTKTIDYELLWSTLQQLLLPAWPADRTHIGEKPIGDAWPLGVLINKAKQTGDTKVTSTIQPFHKLTQWLAYSLKQPFTRVLGVTWTNGQLGTGLPEYRNGGLFVDTKVLSLKAATLKEGLERSGQDLPMFSMTSDVVVEWRAMTVALLDELYKIIMARYSTKGVSLSMEQLLEAGTWKAGRELAAQYRPTTKSSPILLEGDGTLF